MPTYRAIVGLNYPPDKRAEPGDLIADLPGKSIKWLREQGLIEPADAAAAEPVDTTDDPESED